MRDSVQAIPGADDDDALVIDLQTVNSYTHSYFSVSPEQWAFVRSALQDALNRVAEDVKKARKSRAYR